MVAPDSAEREGTAPRERTTPSGQRTEELKGAKVPGTSGATKYLYRCRECAASSPELVNLPHSEYCSSRRPRGDDLYLQNVELVEAP